MLLTHYFRIGWRNLFKHKTVSAINMLGLAIGLAAVILIALFVRHELSYDLQFTNADRIYRISRDFFPRDGSPDMYLATNAPVVAPLLEGDFSEIESAARLVRGPITVQFKEQRYIERTFALADPAFVDIFEFQWLEGSAATALKAPFSIVLTQSTARKYFGDQPAIGKTLVVQFNYPFKVTGIIADLPENTHLAFDALASMASGPVMLGPDFLTGWAANEFYTYVRLQPGVDMASIAAQFPDFMERHFREGSSQRTGMTAYRIGDIHLHSGRQLELRQPGNINTVYSLSAIAVCILIIACINFMNLSSARASLRAKEVGVRKALGASRVRIMHQFLCESVMLAAVAMLLAFALVELSLPLFNQLLYQSLQFNLLNEPGWLAGIALLTLIIGLAAGSYPALVISSFQAAKVLKDSVWGERSGARLRNLLVILQFSITAILLIATSTVYLQTHFAANLSLGFNKDQILVLDSIGGQWEQLKQDVLAHPEIRSVTASSVVPGSQNLNTNTINYEGGEPRVMAFTSVDYNFFKTYDIPLLAGRAFSQDYAADRMRLPTKNEAQGNAAIMLNELAAKQLGWSAQEAIGKGFQINNPELQIRGTVIGVVADAHYESVRDAIRPMHFIVPPPGIPFPRLVSASLRLSGNNLNETLAYIDAAWKKYSPEQPIARRFLDEVFDRLYQRELRLGTLLGYFSLLAILIACLGLYALTSFTTQRRIKEIGVRKALGAKVFDILKLMLWQLSQPVLIANFIAWPVAYYLMSGWLNGFAYRIGKEQIILLSILAGTAALLIAWGTVASNAIRAARARPIKALRYE